MSTYNENKSSNILRTQSYIANGMPNPNFKPNKKDNSTKLKEKKNTKKASNKSKPKTNKNKNYINDVKKQKNQKDNTFNKPNQKQLLKKYINDKCDEKTEIINHKHKNNQSRNILLYNTKTEKFKNINENYLYAKTRHHHVINKYYNKNESKGKENNKNVLNFGNKKGYNNSRILPNSEIDKPNGFHKSNRYTNKINEEYFSKTKKANSTSKFDFQNIENLTKLGIMTTRENIKRTRNKEFRRDIDKIYNMTYRSKIKPQAKMYTTFKKEKNFVNKILSNENDDYLDIKNHRNKNILLNKLNYYTQREKINFKDNCKIKRGLLTIKNLINKKMMLFSPKEDINKLNKISNNIFHHSYSNYKQYNNNCLNYGKNQIKSMNNVSSPALTEYNIKYKKNEDCFSDIFKIKFSKSLSNIINSIKEKRNTSKFIKDLNKNKNYGNNTHKQFKFSFSKNSHDDSIDEFYSPNKSKINNIFSNDTKKLNNNKKINYFIKKNISSDNFQRTINKKNNKINYNAINIRIQNYINSYKEKQLSVMPVNKAIDN